MLSLKFKDRQAFATFCVALKEGRVRFGLPGFENVMLAERDRDRLPPKSETLYAEFNGKGLVEVSRVSPNRKRPRLLTEGETEALLSRLARAH